MQSTLRTLRTIRSAATTNTNKAITTTRTAATGKRGTSVAAVGLLVETLVGSAMGREAGDWEVERPGTDGVI